MLKSLVSGIIVGSVLLTCPAKSEPIKYYDKPGGAYEYLNDKIWMVQNDARWIEVSLDKASLVARQGGDVIQREGYNFNFRIDYGRNNQPTPRGMFTIDHVMPQVNMTDNFTYNVTVYFPIFFDDPSYAIHGMEAGYRPQGLPVSRGCIRLGYLESSVLYREQRDNPFDYVIIF